MSEGQWMSLVYLTAALVLVSSNFWGQRLAWGATLRLALLWVGIFIIVFVVADNRHAIGRAIGILPSDAPVEQPAPDRAEPRKDIA